MFGWESAAMAFASFSKRATAAPSAVAPPRSTLIATSRSRRWSRARYTSLMPPAPIGSTISYGPILLPAASSMNP
jgi:hypothetical protein